MLALVVVLLVVAAVVGDRYVTARAQDDIADRFEAQYPSAGRPQVSISGAPTGLSVLRGDVDQVRLVARDVPTKGAAQPLRLSRVTVTARSLHRQGGDRWRADEVSADAAVSYARLGASLGHRVSYAGDGRLRVTMDTPLGGSVSATSAVAPSGTDALRLSRPTLEGDWPQVVQDLVREVLRTPIRVQGLPEGLRLSSASVDRSGLHVRFTGTDFDV